MRYHQEDSTRNRRRRIVFVTGTRADFGKLKPLIREVQQAPEFEYEVFVTGMHMLARYGSTIHEITAAGFTNVHPYINQDATAGNQMDLALATTLQGLGHYLREARADLLVIHGDRVEALAGAIAGAMNHVPVAHVEGGERSGTVDEMLRHAVTKLAHIHFCANPDARTRLLQLGEDPATVHVIGSPDIDVMLSTDLPSVSEVRDRYDIPFATWSLLLYHPVTTEPHDQRRRARALVDALLGSDRHFVVIYPNNDAGSATILEEYRRFEGVDRVRLIPSMRFEYFLTALRHADLVLGNSSVGIREAPVYGVPTINVGSRQLDRYHGPTIRDVEEEAPALAAALSHPPAAGRADLHFGSGDSAQRFMAALRSEVMWSAPLQKRFVDLPVTSSVELHGVG
ncbi:UDP-N-acetylglucosamine 2-epimerase [Kineococcus sp. SYSU DK001]|uniref:UDP-N-acetylglucosamine 2-epimerase n=1 Tax=Kineococcus sp. SYSU DK001 TaxID=3383122 RepID=UPI003D7CB9B3